MLLPDEERPEAPEERGERRGKIEGYRLSLHQVSVFTLQSALDSHPGQGGNEFIPILIMVNRTATSQHFLLQSVEPSRQAVLDVIRAFNTHAQILEPFPVHYAYVLKVHDVLKDEPTAARE
jgi:hypothetical protein